MPGMENAHALVIGIANYKGIPSLPSTVLKDAQDIADILVDPNVCGYKPENVQLLLDDQATNAAMRQALADLASRSDGDSSVFFYISSHGGRVESGELAGEYLLPIDVEYTSEEAVARTAISGADFTAALNAIPARKVLIAFDCCHSGGIGQTKDARAPMLKAGLPESYYEKLKSGRGRVILASSRSDEFSYVMPGAANSLFTQHLVGGFKGGIPSDDGLVRVFNLFEYLQPKVVKDQPMQHPIFKAEIEENFPVSLYLGGQKGVIKKAEDGYLYDVYLSYTNQDPDETWVWDTLLPKLQEAGLNVAVSEDIEQPGVARVVNIERGLKQARRTVMLLSHAYLKDKWGQFENQLVQNSSINQNSARLFPVLLESFQPDELPDRFEYMLGRGAIDFSNPTRAERFKFMEKLITSLQGPLVTLFD